MRLATSFKDIPSSFGLLIGNFDGVHSGHRALLAEFVAKCRAMDIDSVVLTFDPHPQIFFDPSLENFKICSPERKRNLLFQASLDFVLEKKFDSRLQSQSAEEFLRNEIFSQPHLKLFSVGHDFAMGAGKEQSEKLARTFCLEADVVFTKAQAFYLEGDIVSSSRIRNLIKLGDVESANRLLERRFQVEGHVVAGQQLGREKLVPTLNTNFPPDHLLPLNGVYQTLVKIKGQYFNSITNIGIRPTVTSSDQRVLETNVFEFDENIYGEYIQVEFISFIRKEKKFDNLNQLKKQINQDIKVCQDRFSILNEKRLALIGKGISHSRSQQVYEKLLNKSVIYDLLDYASEDKIPALAEVFAKYAGVSVTAPYKRYFLDKATVGQGYRYAINCLRPKNKNFEAVNTDFQACRKILKSYSKKFDYSQVVILGDGAMSAVLQVILKEEDQFFRVLSRKKENLDQIGVLIEEFQGKSLVINSCAREYHFCFDTNRDVIVWDLNYNADSFDFFSPKKNFTYLDGCELLEEQAKYALTFWNLDSL